MMNNIQLYTMEELAGGAYGYDYQKMNLDKKYVYLLGAFYGSYQEKTEVLGIFETEELAKEAEKKSNDYTYIKKVPLNEIIYRR